MARAAPPEAFLDSWAARIVALLVLVAVIAAVVYLQREDLFGSDQQAGSGNPALDACIAERIGHVETMLEEGVIGPDQADSFRNRAVQFCEGTNRPPD